MSTSARFASGLFLTVIGFIVGLTSAQPDGLASYADAQNLLVQFLAVVLMGHGISDMVRSISSSIFGR